MTQGLRFAPAWAINCQPFRLQRTFCEPRMMLRPERLTLDSPGRSEAEAWVKSTKIRSPERAAHLLLKLTPLGTFTTLVVSLFNRTHFIFMAGRIT